MSLDPSQLNKLQLFFYEKRRLWIELSILSIVTLVMLEIYLFATGFPSFIIQISPILVTPLLGIIAVATFWRSSLSLAVVLMGITCVAGGLFVMPYALSQGLASYDKLTSYTTYLFTIGVGTLAISLIIVYKPELLYAKNRPRNEKGLPTWSREMGGMRPLVPLRSLLSENELFILPNYNFVIVSIDGTKFLVPPNESVPEETIVQRDHGYFIGLRKIFDGYFF